MDEQRQVVQKAWRASLLFIEIPSVSAAYAKGVTMIQGYFRSLYERTMREAYGLSRRAIADSLDDGGHCLDCGAHAGKEFELLNQLCVLDKDRYHGVEWSAPAVEAGRGKGLDIVEGNLNANLKFADEQFQCVFALSVVEHLLNPCRFLREAHRCLKSGGSLIILTPNISTFFTIALLLAGKMPSSGPHPDSDALLKKHEPFRVSDPNLISDTETDTPVHRHLVVFSYRVLLSYLEMLGFSRIEGHAFGLYPFPNFMQKTLERVDPYHCHQMVFVARK